MAILNARKMLFSLAWFLFPSTVSQQTSAWFRDIKVRRQKSSSNEHLSSAVREGLSQSLCHESLRAEHARAAQDLARCRESPHLRLTSRAAIRHRTQNGDWWILDPIVCQKISRLAKNNRTVISGLSSGCADCPVSLTSILFFPGLGAF